MPAKLTLHPPRRPSRIRFIEEGHHLLVGRDPAADCVLDDPRVSKRHARFTWDRDGWRLHDLHSKNGTTVNGRTAGGAPLHDGDWLSLGGLIGRFGLVSAGDVAAFESDRARRLQTPAEIGRELRATANARALLRRFLESAIELTRTERGFVLIVEGDGTFRAEAVSGLGVDSLDDPAFTGSVGAVEQALAGGRSVVLADVKEDVNLARRPSVVEQGLTTIACVPLRHAARCLGVLYVDGRSAATDFTELDLEILEALADQAAIALMGAQLQSEMGALRRQMANRRLAEESTVLAALEQRLRSATSTPEARGGRPPPPAKQGDRRPEARSS